MYIKGVVMNTNQILNLDCRIEGNKEIIQKALRKIKPLAKCKEDIIPIEKIEKCIFVLCRNYNILPRGILTDEFSSDDGIIWKFEFVNASNLERFGICYGISFYEVLAKSAIMLFSKTRVMRKS